MYKKSRLREPLEKRDGKHAVQLLKSTWHYLYHIHWSLPSQLSWKKYLFLTCEILGLLVNIVAEGEKYPLLKRDNLTIPIQMQLSQKQKTFSQLFAAFLKFRLNFKYFEKKYYPHRFFISEITDSKNVIRKMSKKSRFREPFDKQHGKRAQALLKSASQHLYHIHWSLPNQFRWKTSLLLTCQILGLLVNTLAADEKYPVLNRDNLTIPIQMQLSQKQKLFSEFFATFLKSTINFKYFEKRIWSLSILYFPNYGLRKRGEINVLKIPVSEDPSRSNMVNVPKHCSNLHHSCFFHIHWPLPSQLSWKTSLLLTCQILGLLVSTLAADEMYLLLNRDNMTISIQMQLSQKKITFSQFFPAFLKFRLNFKYSQTKYIPLRFCISGITDFENVVREITKKPRLRERFDKQHGKRAQALLESASY